MPHRTSSTTLPGADQSADEGGTASLPNACCDGAADHAVVSQPPRLVGSWSDQPIARDDKGRALAPDEAGSLSANSSAVFGSMDAATIARAIGGDVAARERLWFLARPWVVAMVVAHKPRHAEVEDLVQDIAAKFVRSLSSVAEPSAFAGWIRTVTINTARSAGRRAKVESGAVASAAGVGHGVAGGCAEQVMGGGVFPDQRAAAVEDRRRLLERVAELPEMYREPLLLKSARGLTTAQIGAMLGLTVAAVESRLARARRMLTENCDTS